MRVAADGTALRQDQRVLKDQSVPQDQPVLWKGELRLGSPGSPVLLWEYADWRAGGVSMAKNSVPEMS